MRVPYPRLHLPLEGSQFSKIVLHDVIPRLRDGTLILSNSVISLTLASLPCEGPHAIQGRIILVYHEGYLIARLGPRVAKPDRYQTQVPILLPSLPDAQARALGFYVPAKR